MKYVLPLALAAISLHAEYASVDDTRVYYEASGKGEPAVVLVHGWTCDSTFWRLQQPELAKSFRVLAIDLPGHGRSDKPQVEYTPDRFARAVLGAMRAAKIDRAVLVGHSMGTTVIRKALDLDPARVAALVSVDGAVFRSESPDFQTKFKSWAATMRGPNGVDVRRGFIESMYRPSTTPALREEITSKMLATPEHVAVSAMTNMATGGVWSGAKARVPVLAVNKKAASDGTERLHREVFESLVYRELDDVSHFLHMERPQEVNAILIEFIKKAGR